MALSDVAVRDTRNLSWYNDMGYQALPGEIGSGLCMQSDDFR